MRRGDDGGDDDDLRAAQKYNIHLPPELRHRAREAFVHPEEYTARIQPLVPAIERGDLHAVMAAWHGSHVEYYRSMPEEQRSHPLLVAIHHFQPDIVAFFVCVGLDPLQYGKLYPYSGDNLSSEAGELRRVNAGSLWRLLFERNVIEGERTKLPRLLREMEPFLVQSSSGVAGGGTSSCRTIAAAHLRSLRALYAAPIPDAARLKELRRTHYHPFHFADGELPNTDADGVPYWAPPGPIADNLAAALVTSIPLEVVGVGDDSSRGRGGAQQNQAGVPTAAAAEPLPTAKEGRVAAPFFDVLRASLGAHQLSPVYAQLDNAIVRTQYAFTPSHEDDIGAIEFFTCKLLEGRADDHGLQPPDFVVAGTDTSIARAVSRVAHLPKSQVWRALPAADSLNHPLLHAVHRCRPAVVKYLHGVGFSASARGTVLPMKDDGLELNASDLRACTPLELVDRMLAAARGTGRKHLEGMKAKRALLRSVRKLLLQYAGSEPPLQPQENSAMLEPHIDQGHAGTSDRPISNGPDVLVAAQLGAPENERGEFSRSRGGSEAGSVAFDYGPPVSPRGWNIHDANDGEVLEIHGAAGVAAVLNERGDDENTIRGDATSGRDATTPRLGTSPAAVLAVSPAVRPRPRKWRRKQEHPQALAALLRTRWRSLMSPAVYHALIVARDAAAGAAKAMQANKDRGTKRRRRTLPREDARGRKGSIAADPPLVSESDHSASKRRKRRKSYAATSSQPVHRSDRAALGRREAVAARMFAEDDVLIVSERSDNEVAINGRPTMTDSRKHNKSAARKTDKNKNALHGRRKRRVDVDIAVSSSSDETSSLTRRERDAQRMLPKHRGHRREPQGITAEDGTTDAHPEFGFDCLDSEFSADSVSDDSARGGVSNRDVAVNLGEGLRVYDPDEDGPLHVRERLSRFLISSDDDDGLVATHYAANSRGYGKSRRMSDVIPLESTTGRSHDTHARGRKTSWQLSSSRGKASARRHHSSSGAAREKEVARRHGISDAALALRRRIARRIHATGAPREITITTRPSSPRRSRDSADGRGSAAPMAAAEDFARHFGGPRESDEVVLAPGIFATDGTRRALLPQPPRHAVDEASAMQHFSWSAGLMTHAAAIPGGYGAAPSGGLRANLRNVLVRSAAVRQQLADEMRARTRFAALQRWNDLLRKQVDNESAKLLALRKQAADEGRARHVHQLHAMINKAQAGLHLMRNGSTAGMESKPPVLTRTIRMMLAHLPYSEKPRPDVRAYFGSGVHGMGNTTTSSNVPLADKHTFIGPFGDHDARARSNASAASADCCAPSALDAAVPSPHAEPREGHAMATNRMEGDILVAMTTDASRPLRGGASPAAARHDDGDRSEAIFVATTVADADVFRLTSAAESHATSLVEPAAAAKAIVDVVHDFIVPASAVPSMPRATPHSAASFEAALCSVRSVVDTTSRSEHVYLLTPWWTVWKSPARRSTVEESNDANAPSLGTDGFLPLQMVSEVPLSDFRDGAAPGMLDDAEDDDALGLLLCRFEFMTDAVAVVVEQLTTWVPLHLADALSAELQIVRDVAAIGSSGTTNSVPAAVREARATLRALARALHGISMYLEDHCGGESNDAVRVLERVMPAALDALTLPNVPAPDATQTPANGGTDIAVDGDAATLHDSAVALPNFAKPGQSRPRDTVNDKTSAVADTVRPRAVTACLVTLNNVSTDTNGTRHAPEASPSLRAHAIVAVHVLLWVKRHAKVVADMSVAGRAAAGSCVRAIVAQSMQVCIDFPSAMAVSKTRGPVICSEARDVDAPWLAVAVELVSLFRDEPAVVVALGLHGSPVAEAAALLRSQGILPSWLAGFDLRVDANPTDTKGTVNEVAVENRRHPLAFDSAARTEFILELAVTYAAAGSFKAPQDPDVSRRAVAEAWVTDSWDSPMSGPVMPLSASEGGAFREAYTTSAFAVVSGAVSEAMEWVRSAPTSAAAMYFTNSLGRDISAASAVVWTSSPAARRATSNSAAMCARVLERAWFGQPVTITIEQVTRTSRHGNRNIALPLGTFAARTSLCRLAVVWRQCGLLLVLAQHALRASPYMSSSAIVEHAVVREYLRAISAAHDSVIAAARPPRDAFASFDEAMDVTVVMPQSPQAVPIARSLPSGRGVTNFPRPTAPSPAAPTVVARLVRARPVVAVLRGLRPVRQSPLLRISRSGGTAALLNASAVANLCCTLPDWLLAATAAGRLSEDVRRVAQRVHAGWLHEPFGGPAVEAAVRAAVAAAAVLRSNDDDGSNDEDGAGGDDMRLPNLQDVVAADVRTIHALLGAGISLLPSRIVSDGLPAGVREHVSRTAQPGVTHAGTLPRDGAIIRFYAQPPDAQVVAASGHEASKLRISQPVTGSGRFWATYIAVSGGGVALPRDSSTAPDKVSRACTTHAALHSALGHALLYSFLSASPQKLVRVSSAINAVAIAHCDAPARGLVLQAAWAAASFSLRRMPGYAIGSDAMRWITSVATATVFDMDVRSTALIDVEKRTGAVVGLPAAVVRPIAAISSTSPLKQLAVAREAAISEWSVYSRERLTRLAAELLIQDLAVLQLVADALSTLLDVEDEVQIEASLAVIGSGSAEPAAAIWAHVPAASSIHARAWLPTQVSWNRVDARGAACDISQLSVSVTPLLLMLPLALLEAPRIAYGDARGITERASLLVPLLPHVIHSALALVGRITDRVKVVTSKVWHCAVTRVAALAAPRKPLVSQSDPLVPNAVASDIAFDTASTYGGGDWSAAGLLDSHDLAELDAAAERAQLTSVCTASIVACHDASVLWSSLQLTQLEAQLSVTRHESVSPLLHFIDVIQPLSPPSGATLPHVPLHVLTALEHIASAALVQWLESLAPAPTAVGVAANTSVIPVPIVRPVVTRRQASLLAAAANGWSVAASVDTGHSRNDIDEDDEDEQPLRQAANMRVTGDDIAALPLAASDACGLLSHAIRRIAGVWGLAMQSAVAVSSGTAKQSPVRRPKASNPVEQSVAGAIFCAFLDRYAPPQNASETPTVAPKAHTATMSRASGRAAVPRPPVSANGWAPGHAAAQHHFAAWLNAVSMRLPHEPHHFTAYRMYVWPALLAALLATFVDEPSCVIYSTPSGAGASTGAGIDEIDSAASLLAAAIQSTTSNARVTGGALAAAAAILTFDHGTGSHYEHQRTLLNAALAVTCWDLSCARPALELDAALARGVSLVLRGMMLVAQAPPVWYATWDCLRHVWAAVQHTERGSARSAPVPTPLSAEGHIADLQHRHHALLTGIRAFATSSTAAAHAAQVRVAVRAITNGLPLECLVVQ